MSSYKVTYQHRKMDVGAERPFVLTICDVIDCRTGLLAAKGVAICSFRDQYDRKKGNRIAYGRAKTALYLEKSGGPVRPELISGLNLEEGLWFKSLYIEGRSQ